MYQREITKECLALAQDYPILTIVGPRQSGKTTLVQKIFPNKPYANLENPDTRALAENDPRGFLEKFPDGAILDEIQRQSELLSYIQTLVDEKDKKGFFILTGSHQLSLHQAISQSLAGRTAILTLFPLSLDELMKSDIKFSMNDAILKGGYPRVYKDQLNPYKAYRSYFQTYVERDIRQLINVKDLGQFERFIKLCAGRIGQILNLEGIGGEIGISSHTVKEWLSLLEASFLIFFLQPYFDNFGKRIIKSPKLYFTDVGLASYLLGIQNETHLERDPLRGHLIENLIILELLKWRHNHGFDPQLYFYRDVKKNEVDLIFKDGHLLIPIEIKSSKTFNPSFLKKVEWFQKLAQDRSPRGYIIYGGDQEQKIRSTTLLNFKNAIHAILPKR